MKPFFTVLFFIAFISFCAVTGICASILLFPFGLFHPAIACDTPALNLGTIDSNKNVDCQFTIKNTGNRTLELHDVTPVCGSGNEILLDEYSLLPLKPGEQRTLSFRFFPFFCRGDTLRKLVVSSDDPRFPKLVLSVKATVNHVPSEPTPEPKLAPLMEL